MSVEYCVMRVSPQGFETLQEQPALVQDLMDEFYAAAFEKGPEKTFVDSREVFRGTPVTIPPVLRMLYLDEFTTSLLVSFLDESAAPFRAIAGWGSAHLLENVRYGYGEVSCYFPEEVKTILRELEAYAQARFEDRFWQEAGNFRMASAGYFKDDAAILAHQRLFTDLLRRFYKEAARDGEFVLLLTV